MWVRLVRLHIDGGIVWAMLALTMVRAVTEPSGAHVTSGQVQWEEEEAQWEREEGFDQWRLSWRRMAASCSFVVVCVFPWKGSTVRRRNMVSCRGGV